MRRMLLFLALAACAAAQKKPITLDALEEISRLAPQGRGNPAAWSPDGTEFVCRQGGKLVIYDIPTNSSKDLIDTSPMESAAIKRSPSAPEPFQWENRRVSDSNLQWSSRGSEIL